MEKTFFTKEGMIQRQLIEQEIVDMAAMGDMDCKKELVKSKLLTVTKIEDKVDLILDYLGLK
jgi:hypothetical protein